MKRIVLVKVDDDEPMDDTCQWLRVGTNWAFYRLVEIQS